MIVQNEVCGYLPYRLNVLRPDNKTILEVTGMIGRLYVFNELGEETYGAIRGNNKPILHPLSDLTKPIKRDGKEFVPNKWFLENYSFFDLSKDDMDKLIKMVNYIFSSPTKAPHWFVRKLYEWHFDIHGLIERGDAIDINTLKK